MTVVYILNGQYIGRTAQHLAVKITVHTKSNRFAHSYRFLNSQTFSFALHSDIFCRACTLVSIDEVDASTIIGTRTAGTFVDIYNTYKDYVNVYIHSLIIVSKN